MHISEILSDVKVEGENPFKDETKENETPVESAPTKEQSEEKPASGDNTKTVPFHQDPRWQEMHAKASKVDDLEREINELKASREVNNSTNIPQWFKNLYGENQEAWNEYSKYDKENREQIKQELRQEQEKERQQQVTQQKYWDKWVDDQLSKLETSGKKFDRNELLKVMYETRPTDEQGNFDFEAGYKILQYRSSSNAGNSQARKQIADTVTKSSRGEAKTKDYMTSNELRRKNWNDL